MSQTVYLVSNGDEYEPAFLGMFSDEGQAEEFCNLYRSKYDSHPPKIYEEFELDQLVQFLPMLRQGMNRYYIRTAKEGEAIGSGIEITLGGNEFYIHRRSYQDDNGDMMAYLWAFNEADAIGQTNALRERLVSEGLWAIGAHEELPLPIIGE